MTKMARKRFNVPPARHAHAGLWLDRYLPERPDDSCKKGEALSLHIAQTCRLAVPPIYEKAYERWRDRMVEQAALRNAAVWAGKIDGRLFLGLGGTSPLEASISLHHAYGVPKLPGSALKGLARAYAAAFIDNTLAEVLFGRAPSGEGEDWDGGEAGYLAFHDAWWIPDGQPLTPEIVTVHHADYYAQRGQATDFDSPVPNPQIAVQGGFLFAVEGVEDWGQEGLRWMREGLKRWGAGGKTAAGYGYFVDHAKEQSKIDALVKKARDADLSGESLLSEEIQTLKERALAEALGKKWTATRERYMEICPGIADTDLHALFEHFHGETLRTWETADKTTNNYKAFKRWQGLNKIANSSDNQ